MRTIFIGDIHGCLDELRALTEKLELTHQDEVICVGDFMDKGPDPIGCVQFAREHGFKAVLGNHEDKHVRFHRHEAKRRRDPGYKNPVQFKHAEDQVTSKSLTMADLEYLQDLPVLLRRGSYVVIHGGLLPGKSLDQHLATKKLWGQALRLRWVRNGANVPVDYDNLKPGPPYDSQHWTECYDGKLHVVYGHEAHSLSQPLVDTNRKGARCYGIDTGCVHGGHLTAMVLQDGAVDFVQVKAAREYAKPLLPIPEGEPKRWATELAQCCECSDWVYVLKGAMLPDGMCGPCRHQ